MLLGLIERSAARGGNRTPRGGNRTPLTPSLKGRKIAGDWAEMCFEVSGSTCEKASYDATADRFCHSAHQLAILMKQWQIARYSFFSDIRMHQCSRFETLFLIVQTVA
jgi:hypothetical protein